MNDDTRQFGPDGPRAYASLELGEGARGGYAELAADTDGRELIERFVIPGKTGKGFTIEAGRILHIECHEGPQVADFILFNRENPAEHFSQSRTRGVHGCHPTTGYQLWSHPLYRRPMMTVIADTVDPTPRPSGAVPHDLLFNMCDETLHFLRTGEHDLPNCRTNLTEAVAEFGLGPEAPHDPFNIFMVTGINTEHRTFYDPTVAAKGDYVELYAEMDLICALSACPGACSGPEPGGLRVEIWAPRP